MLFLNPLIHIFIPSDVLDLADGYNRQSAKKMIWRMDTTVKALKENIAKGNTFAVKSYLCCDIHESTP